MAINFKPHVRGGSRVHFIKDRARPDHVPQYQGCMMVGAPDQAGGDVTRIECPSPTSFGQYITVGKVKGSKDRVTVDLTGRYPANVRSTLKYLFDIGCAMDMHVNLGDCQDPTVNNDFLKKIIFEDVDLTNYGTDELGSLTGDDNTEVNESSSTSSGKWYEVLQLTFAKKGGDIIVNPLEDVVICSRPSCGDCEDPDDGCEIIYAVGDSGPGSPGTAPDLIYSVDGGANLAADDIGSLTDSENADALACLGDYVVVVSNDDCGIHYKTQKDIKDGVAGGWTRNATNIDASGCPMDIWSVGSYAVIVGDGGYVYGISTPTDINVLDAGEATTENLAAVHGISKNFWVAVGANGAVIYTDDQANWQLVTAPAAVALVGVWVKSTTEWHVIGTAGQYYITLDGGDTWDTHGTDYGVAFPVTFASTTDIAFSTDSVGYISGVVGAGGAATGTILRTYDGGYSWVALPEYVGNLPNADSINAIAACAYDANFVVGVGDYDGNDGIFMVGEDVPAV